MTKHFGHSTRLNLNEASHRRVSVTCIKCRTVFEARSGRSTRCPVCRHRYARITESIDHRGQAAQTAVAWDDLVKRGQAADTDTDAGKWELGDLANEVKGLFVPGPYDQDEIRSYAQAIGQPYKNLREYLAVARSYSTPQRNIAVSWRHYARARGWDNRRSSLVQAQVKNLEPQQMKVKVNWASGLGCLSGGCAIHLVFVGAISWAYLLLFRRELRPTENHRAEFQDRKMQPALERALGRRGLLRA